MSTIAAMLSIIFYIFFNILNIIGSIEGLEILTTLGPIKGKVVDDDVTGAYYYSFEGIPYAEAPVGNLRFKPPVPKQPWTSALNATKPGYVCPQSEIFHSRNQMDEDCLNFNIYTPVNFRNKLLPVMIYIHGGEFVLRSGIAEPLYGPQLFILKDIVVVTLNYRIGVLGFLSLCNEEVSGNAGIKDVILLLKIVQENISRFGGDPKKVTIMGSGAGAAIAQLLMLNTNQCNGLFQKAIIQSGSILGAEFFQTTPRQSANQLIQELGLDCKGDDDTLKALINVNVDDIIKAQDVIAQKDPQRGYRDHIPFKPTVEIESESAFITRTPLEMIKEGAIMDIPISIGFNNQQGISILPLLRKEPYLIDRVNKNFELCIPQDIEYPEGSIERRNLAARIKDFYLDGENVSLHNVQNYINLVTDSQYVFGIDYFIKLYKEKKFGPLYYYIFEADTELNWFKKFQNITYPGASHNDDLGYTFITSATKPLYQSLDYTTRRALESTMINLKYFIYYGYPAPNPYVNYWPEAGLDRYHLRQGSDSIPVYHRPLSERMDFWNKVYEEYYNSTSNIAPYLCTKQQNDAISHIN